MYTIIMNQDKSLITSVKTTLYQRESLVDKIQFLLPQTYGDKNLKDFIVALKYIDQGNIPRLQILSVDEDLYKDKIRCVIDVDVGLTKFAGDIAVHLSFLRLNTETGLREEVMHSGETTITIQPVKDYYSFVPNESLEVIDRKLLELEAKAEALDNMATTYESQKADDIALDTESSSLYLKSNGKKIGNEIPLNDLGDSLSESTEDGLIQVITEDEIIVPGKDPNTTITYTLQLNQDTDELYLLANGKIVSVIPSSELAESIIDVTSEEGMNEVVT